MDAVEALDLLMSRSTNDECTSQLRGSCIADVAVVETELIVLLLCLIIRSLCI